MESPHTRCELMSPILNPQLNDCCNWNFDCWQEICGLWYESCRVKTLRPWKSSSTTIVSFEPCGNQGWNCVNQATNILTYIPHSHLSEIRKYLHKIIIIPPHLVRALHDVIRSPIAVRALGDSRHLAAVLHYFHYLHLRNFIRNLFRIWFVGGDRKNRIDGRKYGFWVEKKKNL